MSGESGLAEKRTKKDQAARTCTLHVCVSCRANDCPREPRQDRTGAHHYRELRAFFENHPLRDRVEVKPVQCLSLCPRPCGIALSSPGKWSYLFGDQQQGSSAEDIAACVALYLVTDDGVMPREERPKSLRASILGRVPPMSRAG
ncbi:MAG: DUF1636 domain-containing protein [Myxococcota bacterium]